MPKMSEEEFKKLPKQEQERLAKARKEREQKQKQLASKEVSSDTTATLSEKQFNGKYTRTCAVIRENIRILTAKKQIGTLKGEELYNTLKESVMGLFE